MNDENKRFSMSERWLLDDRYYCEAHIREWLFPVIVGGIIGDALGVPVEFRDRDTFKITEMQGYGTYNQPAGTWSDDTSLTLCLMETLVEEGTPDELMKKFVRYRGEGYLTPYGKMFDIGVTTDQSINRFLSGMPAEKCGSRGEMDNGNGSLMRIAPLIAPLLNEIDHEIRQTEVRRWSEITHNHPRSIVGCFIYMDILFAISDNSSLIDSLEYANECTRSLSFAFASETDCYQRILDYSIITAPRESIKSSGYIVDTLEAAIWCLFNTDNFKDAVLTAVNLGGDTDTVAFVTGTLAGMYYKQESIPQEWIDQLADNENLMAHINQYIQYYVDKALMEEFGTLDPHDFETMKAHRERYNREMMKHLK